VTSPLRILVAGGGFAAAELLLALRALGEERVDLELISSSRVLPLRPTATADPTGGAVDLYDLGELAAEVGARFRVDALEAVAPAAHRARLASGGVATYDALVLALGARPRAAVPGAVTYRDQRAAPQLARLLATRPERVVFAVPAGVTWSLPIYELALRTVREPWARAVSIVTPERFPLEAFGRTVGAHVAGLLLDAGVRFLGDTPPQVPLGTDAVVAVPRLVGRRISGIPGDWNGFVPTGARGWVEGIPDVFAAGDMTSFPVKQGGLAAQQADRIAELLALRAGADVEFDRARPILRTRLFGAPEPTYLHAELDDDGRPVAGVVSDEAPWWPGAKVFGRYLTPWMAMRDALPVAA
jgi:sulfide:quinone oxidoreductase